MESAQWEAAAAAFAAALSALSAEPPSASRAQRCAFAAQYLAAVMLLKAAGADSTPKGAKLYRWVCVTPLRQEETPLHVLCLYVPPFSPLSQVLLLLQVLLLGALLFRTVTECAQSVRGCCSVICACLPAHTHTCTRLLLLLLNGCPPSGMLLV